MPRRGDNLLGLKKFKDSRTLMSLYSALRGVCKDNIYQEIKLKGIDYYMKQSYPKRDKEFYNELRGLLTGSIDWNSYKSSRKVQGTGFEPNNPFEGNPILTKKLEENDYPNLETQEQCRLKGGGALSLDDVALKVGDVMRFTYDFGTASTLVMKVKEIKNNANLLPEVDYCSHPTRAKVIKEKHLNRLPKQYRARDDDYSDFY